MVDNFLKIPVFKGAHSSLITIQRTINADDLFYHGSDGFGDFFQDEIDTSRLKNDHAAVALRNIAVENPSNFFLSTIYSCYS